MTIVKISGRGEVTQRWRHRLGILNKQYFGFSYDFNRDIVHWWVAAHEGAILGFAGSRYDSDGSVFLGPCGVVPEARGRGLQRQFVRVRERDAAANGFQILTTHTHFENYHSANNLITCGFRICPPPSGIEDHNGEFIFFRKEIANA